MAKAVVVIISWHVQANDRGTDKNEAIFVYVLIEMLSSIYLSVKWVKMDIFNAKKSRKQQRLGVVFCTRWANGLPGVWYIVYFNLKWPNAMRFLLGPLLLTWFNFNPSMDK